MFDGFTLARFFFDAYLAHSCKYSRVFPFLPFYINSIISAPSLGLAPQLSLYVANDFMAYQHESHVKYLWVQKPCNVAQPVACNPFFFLLSTLLASLDMPPIGLIFCNICFLLSLSLSLVKPHNYINKSV
mgnify:CR=1 FL=1